jgi:hypothetical protein
MFLSLFALIALVTISPEWSPWFGLLATAAVVARRLLAPAVWPKWFSAPIWVRNLVFVGLGGAAPVFAALAAGRALPDALTQGLLTLAGATVVNHVLPEKTEESEPPAAS